MERALALSTVGALPHAATSIRQGRGSPAGIGRAPHAPPRHGQQREPATGHRLGLDDSTAVRGLRAQRRRPIIDRGLAFTAAYPCSSSHSW